MLFEAKQYGTKIGYLPVATCRSSSSNGATNCSVEPEMVAARGVTDLCRPRGSPVAPAQMGIRPLRQIVVVPRA
jgi:hypothetical protein